jgi:hypothetical protein
VHGQCRLFATMNGVAREFVSLDRSAGIRKQPDVAQAMTPLRRVAFSFQITERNPARLEIPTGHA